MDALMAILPVILYVLAIVLLGVLIVLGIKLIETVDRANVVLDDIERKSRSLNGFFGIIDTITDTVSFVSDNVVNGIVTGISKLFGGKNTSKSKKKKEIEDNE